MCSVRYRGKKLITMECEIQGSQKYLNLYNKYSFFGKEIVTEHFLPIEKCTFITPSICVSSYYTIIHFLFTT